MKAKVFQVGLLVASIFAVSNMAHAETVSIDPLAVESYSKEFSVTSQEAERRLTIVSQLDSITQKLNTQFGDSIASVYFDNGNDFKLVVRTTKKGKTQREVMDLSGELSKTYDLPIEVVANSPRNFRAIDNIIENQGSRIARQYDGFQSIGYNPQKDAISIIFYQPDVAEQNRIRSKLSKISGMDVTLRFLNEPITATAANFNEVVGGGNLESMAGTGQCTAGFTGTMNGVPGFLTATHCLNNSKRYVNRFGKKYDFGTPVTDSSAYHEVSFVPLNSPSITGEVYRAWPSTTSTSNLKIKGMGVAQAPRTDLYTELQVGGTPLCHMGLKTGYSCGTVTGVNQGIGGAGCNASIKGIITQRDCARTIITVEGSNFRIDVGDSGGPFFDGNGNAYGLASAKGGSNFAFVTPLNYLTGFKLKTEL